MSVTRCVCHDVTFRELRALAAALDPDRQSPEDELLRELAARTGCTTGCGTCRPYIRRMLRTGETSMPVMSPAQVRAIEGATRNGRAPGGPPASTGGDQ